MPAHRAIPDDRTRRRRFGAGIAVLFCALCVIAGLTARAPAQSATEELSQKMDELESNVDQQGGLQATIDRQNAQINSLIAAESELRRKADAVQAELDERQTQLREATASLNAEKAHLAEVQAELDRALAELETLLVEIYKSSDPDTLSVVLNSSSWDDLLTQTEYLERIQNYDEAVIERVTTLRAEVESTVASLAEIQQRIKVARDEVAARRAELAQAQAEIDAQHSQLAAARQERQASLDALQAREKTLEDDLGTSIPNPGERATLGSDGDAIPPPGAPLAVKAAIEAANRINHLPYVWGGGHGSFEDSGYDCSGAVSYMLNGGGMLSSPLDSGGFTAWGSPGGGDWITVYANSGHVYAHVAGLRWDTSGNSGGSGPRWHSDLRSPGGFIPRHPDGF